MKKFQTSSYEFSIPRQVSRQISQDLFRQEQEILDKILLFHKVTRCKSRQDKFTFGTQVSSFKMLDSRNSNFQEIPDIMKTPFDKFEDKITFGASSDKRKLILMQTDRTNLFSVQVDKFKERFQDKLIFIFYFIREFVSKLISSIYGVYFTLINVMS